MHRRGTRKPWSPALNGSAADAARASAARIADALVAALKVDRPRFSLAEGHAGYALTLAYLSKCLDRPALLEPAHEAWRIARDTLASRQTTAALHGGFCGPAWVAAHLGKSVCVDVDDDAFVDIEQALVDHLEPRPHYPNYDLIGGMVGYGVYALERWPNGMSNTILEMVVDRIVTLAEPTLDGVTWTTPYEEIHPLQRGDLTRGYQNLGMAHGIPGIIALLARVGAVKGLSTAAARTLDLGVRWLLSTRTAHPSRLMFPAWIVGGNEEGGVARDGSRVAWCYGDLGVSLALWVAGESSGREDWCEIAIQIGSNCATVAPEQTQVRDHGLCHGSSGVGHLFARLANATGEARLWEASRFWLKRTLDTRVPGWGTDGYVSLRAKSIDVARYEDIEHERTPDSSFLSGTAGIALALAAAFSPEEPAWDRVLLVSA